MDLDKYMDVDYLRSLGKKPQWFGLGFIQLKISFHNRLHFWDPSLASLVNPEELHDHRYGFKSFVLAGEVEHDVYSFKESKEGTHEMCEVFCQPEKSSPPKVIATGNIQSEGCYTMTAGSHCRFPVGRFHKGSAQLAVTYLERDKPEKDVARIIRPLQKSAGWACPFSGKLSQDECWQAIENIIASAPR